MTTTGRKSGQPRTSHLISIPHGETLALLGTNFGQPGDPGLGAQPRGRPARARVQLQGPRHRRGGARPAADDEVGRDLRARPREVYGGYAKYQQRITGRRVRVFVLEQPAWPLSAA